MQPNDFIFQLITPDGTMTLDLAPDGWKDCGTEWERHARAGYGRKFIAELQFVGYGYEILRDQYAKYGVEANVQLYIQRLDTQTYLYHPYFIGDFDFSESQDNRFNGGFYTAQINEAGFSKMLSARSKDTYELQLPETIHIDHVANAQQVMNWVGYEKYDSTDQTTPFIGYIESYNSDVSSNHLIQQSGIIDRVGVAKILTYKKWLDKNDTLTLNFKIDGTLNCTNYTYPGGAEYLNYVVRLNRVNANNVNINEVKTLYNGSINGVGKKTFSYSETLTLPQYTNDNINDQEYMEIQIFIYARLNIPAGTVVETDFQVSMDGWSEPLLAPFEVKAIKLSDAFTQLCQKIAGDMPVVATYKLLTTDMYLVSGDSARGIDSAVLKTSFNDLFESLDGVYGVALFNDSVNVSLEEYASAFRNELIADLGEVMEFSIRPYKEAMFNYASIGSSDADYEASNGRFEFNTVNEFSLPLTRIIDEKNFIGKYRTDSFGITDLRLSYSKKSTASDKSDNDVFLIHTKNTNGRITPYEDQTIIGDAIQLQRTGVFNLFFSPKRCLMRQAGRIAGVLQNTDGKALYRTTAKTDAVLISKLNGEYADSANVVELTDYQIDLTKSVWWPRIYSFTSNIPDNIAELMSAKVGGHLTFIHDGLKYKGFPLRVSEKPHTNKEQEVELIAFPEEPQIN